MKKSLFLFILLFIFFCSPVLGREEIEVSPTIIDQKAKARDLLEFSIKVTNNTPFRATIYPIVDDLSLEDGRQKVLDPSNLDKSVSFFSWIRISRAEISLSPGETREIPLSIEVNLSAKPGKYYATVIFSRGSTREIAEVNALKINEPEVLLVLEVEENIIERAQIKDFKPAKNVFLSLPASFSLKIENTGNKEIIPKGEVHIYDRKGKELSVIDLSYSLIAPKEEKLFEVFWQENKGFGRYRARLFVKYGEEEKKDLQDTLYFWIFPWKFLIIFGIIILFLIIILYWLIFIKIKKNRSSSFFNEKIIDLRKGR